LIILTNIYLKESFQLKALKIPHVEKKTLICFYVVKRHLRYKQSEWWRLDIFTDHRRTCKCLLQEEMPQGLKCRHQFQEPHTSCALVPRMATSWGVSLILSAPLSLTKAATA